MFVCLVYFLFWLDQLFVCDVSLCYHCLRNWRMVRPTDGLKDHGMSGILYSTSAERRSIKIRRAMKIAMWCEIHIAGIGELQNSPDNRERWKWGIDWLITRNSGRTGRCEAIRRLESESSGTVYYIVLPQEISIGKWSFWMWLLYTKKENEICWKWRESFNEQWIGRLKNPLKVDCRKRRPFNFPFNTI